MGRWLVLGIAGVTCGGKSTISSKLRSLYPKSRILCMDQFFLPPDNPSHILVPGMQHNNWERLEALDTKEWKNAIKNVLDSNPDSLSASPQVIPNFDNADNNKLQPTVPIPDIKNQGLLILDGLLTLNEPWISSKCHMKFYFTLTKEQCYERRIRRTYDPPDPPGYFEACVWPEHIRMKQEVETNNPDVIMIDGSKPKTELLDLTLKQIDIYVNKFDG